MKSLPLNILLLALSAVTTTCFSVNGGCPPSCFLGKCSSSTTTTTRLTSGFPSPAASSSPSSSCRRGNTMIMRERACDLLGKTANRKARVVTFSHRRIHKVQQVNLHWRRYFSDKMRRMVRMRLSTKGMKTVNKYGSIDAAATALGVDIAKF